MIFFDPIHLHIESYIKRLTQENLSLWDWIRVSETPTCVVCGLPIENVSLQRLSRPILWHSKACYRAKPKKVILLEQEYGCDIAEILKKTTAIYGSIQAQCDALGVSIPYFYDLIRKFCGGVSLNDFMRVYSVGTRKTLYEKKSQTLVK